MTLLISLFSLTKENISSCKKDFTLVVGLCGILLPHLVLSPTKLAHGSKRCPADILVGKLEIKGERGVREDTLEHQVKVEWVKHTHAHKLT